METVIIVSVLSTLCAVALVGSIVVLYRRSKNKVDVVELNDYRRDIDERLNTISQQINEEISSVYRHTEEREKELRNEIDALRRESRNDLDSLRSALDSRCDKLHSMIQTGWTNDGLKKQILKS